MKSIRIVNNAINTALRQMRPLKLAKKSFNVIDLLDNKVLRYDRVDPVYNGKTTKRYTSKINKTEPKVAKTIETILP